MSKRQIQVFAKNSALYIFTPILLGLVILLSFSIIQSSSHISMKIIVFIFSFLLIVIGFYMAIFFRDPDRKIIIDNSLIYAPADGKIIYMKEENKLLKIAIRMSPFDVHINRLPLAGKLISKDRKPGKHTSVYFGNIEEKNERNLMVFENEEVIFEILQLTGAFARRIENWIEIGQLLKQGQKIGIIRFGSQTNLTVKLNNETKSFKIIKKVGDQVYAGLSPLAKII